MVGYLILFLILYFQYKQSTDFKYQYPNSIFHGFNIITKYVQITDIKMKSSTTKHRILLLWILSSCCCCCTTIRAFCCCWKYPTPVSMLLAMWGVSMKTGPGLVAMELDWDGKESLLCSSMGDNSVMQHKTKLFQLNLMLNV